MRSCRRAGLGLRILGLGWLSEILSQWGQGCKTLGKRDLCSVCPVDLLLEQWEGETVAPGQRWRKWEAGLDRNVGGKNVEVRERRRGQLLVSGLWLRQWCQYWATRERFCLEAEDDGVRMSLDFVCQPIYTVEPWTLWVWTAWIHLYVNLKNKYLTVFDLQVWVWGCGWLAICFDLHHFI